MEALKGLHSTFRGLFDRLEVRLKQDRKQAEEGLKRELSSLKAFRRKATGYNRPEDCLKDFEQHVTLLKTHAEEERIAESQVRAIDNAIQSVSGGSFQAAGGEMVFTLDEESSKKTKEMSKIKVKGG